MKKRIGRICLSGLMSAALFLEPVCAAQAVDAAQAPDEVTEATGVLEEASAVPESEGVAEASGQAESLNSDSGQAESLNSDSGQAGSSDSIPAPAESEPGSTRHRLKNYGLRPGGERMEHHPVTTQEAGVDGASFESKYVSDYYTEVNDQGDTGSCWAFGNTSALEGSVNKRYKKYTEFSWKNLAYHAWHKSDVNYGPESKDYNECVFVQSTFNQGPQDDYGYGNYAPGGRSSSSAIDCVGNDTAYLFAGGQAYTAALLYWQGRCMKEDTGDDALNVNLSQITSYLDQAGKVGGSASDGFRLKDAYVLSMASSNTDNVKAMLKEYGAGAISYYAGDNDTESVYVSDSEVRSIQQEYAQSGYETEDISNHTITLVGWDDNYSASNFGRSSGGSGGWGGGYSGSGSTPPGDGAWICINSWGTGSDSGTDNGKTYISYYDGSLQYSETIFYNAYQKGDSDAEFLWSDNSYGTEGYDMPVAKNDDRARGLIYTAESDETMTAFSALFAEDASSYTLSVYGNPSTENGSINLAANTPLLTQQIDVSLAGIHTVALDKAIGVKKGQTVIFVLKPQKSVKTLVSSAQDVTEEEAYWQDELYLGHMHSVSDASGMSLVESSNNSMTRMSDSDVLMRVYSNNSIASDAVTFEGSDFKLEDAKQTDTGSGNDSGNSGSGGTPASYIATSYSFESGADKYEVTWTQTVPYTGYPHVLVNAGKKNATPDIEVNVTKNGTKLSPGEFKVKFKNNKFVSGYKGKSPELYVRLGKTCDKYARNTLKRMPLRFEIRQCNISKDLDLTNFYPSLNAYWDRVTKLHDIYDAHTRTPVKLKVSRNGFSGDIVARVTDNNTYISVTLTGINNCTGQVTEEFEVESDGGYGGYGGGGYGGYDDGYGGGGYGGYDDGYGGGGYGGYGGYDDGGYGGGGYGGGGWGY